MDAMLLSFTSLGVSLSVESTERSWASDDTLFAGISLTESFRYNVIHAAMMDITEQAIITLSSPSRVATGKNIMEPRRAPTFPLAAQTPFNVERHEREKVMLGIIKV